MQLNWKLPSLLLVVGLIVLNQPDCFAQSQNQAAVLRGEGAFLQGLGWYNLNTARAESINTDTVIRWKQDLRKIESERRDLLARKEAGKKFKIEDVKQRQRMRERELRVSPTSEDIQNGAALNALLYDLTDPDISCSKWSSKIVGLPKEMSVKDLIFRFTPSNGPSNASKALSRGVIALSRLDVEGKKWPTVMKQDELQKERIAFEDAYAKLRNQLVNDHFNHNALLGLDRSLDALKAKTETAVPKDRGFREEALKYVSDLKDATRMFDAATVDYAKEILVDTRDNDATTVAELVAFMLKYRLQFASAERSATGRVLYGQIYEVLQQQAREFGIMQREEVVVKGQIPRNVAENIRALRVHRPRYTSNEGPPELTKKLDAVVSAAAKNDPNAFDAALDSALRCAKDFERPDGTGKNAKADVLSVLSAIKNGHSDLSELSVYDGSMETMRKGLPGVNYGDK